MSVFQDVTAVPFVIIIPVLGMAAASQIAGSFGMALREALGGRGGPGRLDAYLLASAVPPGRRTATRPELFHLTVAVRSLIAADPPAAGAVDGRSVPFGGWCGVRPSSHQVESTVRPFP